MSRMTDHQLQLLLANAVMASAPALECIGVSMRAWRSEACPSMPPPPPQRLTLCVLSGAPSPSSNRPILPITKEEVEAEKARLRAVDARPIKKVGAARQSPACNLAVQVSGSWQHVLGWAFNPTWCMAVLKVLQYQSPALPCCAACPLSSSLTLPSAGGRGQGSPAQAHAGQAAGGS
jgi:hypothetical protein